MATLPLEAKVEIEVVAMVGRIVDIEEQKSDALRIKATLPSLLLVVPLVLCTTIYLLILV